MKLRQKIRNIALSGLLASVSLLAAGNPMLQLGILGGTYDAATQTIISSSTHFSLFAFLTPQNNTSSSALTALLNDTYYISMAVTPEVGPIAPATSLGSFTVNGFTGQDSLDPMRSSSQINGRIDVVADMVYGTPPMDCDYVNGLMRRDSGDLSTHSIFPTFFTERTFQFSRTQTAGLLNTQDNPGLAGMTTGTATLTPGSNMAYRQFDIDTTGITPGHAIHFDLYSLSARTCANAQNCTDVDVNKFAPYSHDAESINVPEPGTLLLLGLGLIGLGFFRMKRQHQ